MSELEDLRTRVRVLETLQRRHQMSTEGQLQSTVFRLRESIKQERAQLNRKLTNAHRRGDQWQTKYLELAKSIKPIKTGLLEICRKEQKDSSTFKIATNCLKYLEDL